MITEKPMMILGIFFLPSFVQRDMWSRIDTLDEDGGEALGRSSLSVLHKSWIQILFIYDSSFNYPKINIYNSK